jgi:hypothetical protein
MLVLVLVLVLVLELKGDDHFVAIAASASHIDATASVC